MGACLAHVRRMLRSGSCGGLQALHRSARLGAGFGTHRLDPVNAQVGSVSAQMDLVNAQIGIVNALLGTVNAKLGPVNAPLRICTTRMENVQSMHNCAQSRAMQLCSPNACYATAAHDCEQVSGLRCGTIVRSCKRELPNSNGAYLAHVGFFLGAY